MRLMLRCALLDCTLVLRSWTEGMIHALIDGVNTKGEGHWTEIYEAYDFPCWMRATLLEKRWRMLRFSNHVAFNGQKWILRCKLIGK